MLDNKKKITDMTVEEIYTYIDSAKSFIEKRAEYNQNQSKWDSAKLWGQKHGMIFDIVTEEQLFAK